MNSTDMFWAVDRIIVQVLIFAFLIYIVRVLVKNAKVVRDLLKQGQIDKQAREVAISELKKETDVLADAAREALEKHNTEVKLHLEQFDKKMDQNMELTVKAAEASATAAEVANSVNQKIERTNERLEEQHKDAKKKGH